MSIYSFKVQQKIRYKKLRPVGRGARVEVAAVNPLHKNYCIL
jgi:hypothetical protein